MVRSHAGNRLDALQRLARGGNALMFDGFGAADVLTEAKALALVTKMKLAYAAGGAVQYLFPLDFQDLLARAPGMAVVELFLPDVLRSPSKAAQVKAYSDLGKQIDDWADRKLRWAQAGRRDDGTAYSWQRWGELAQVYLDSILYYSKISVTDGYFANAATAAKEFMQSLVTVFQPTEWPTWAKLAAGAAGLAAVAYFVNTLRGATRT